MFMFMGVSGPGLTGTGEMVTLFSTLPVLPLSWGLSFTLTLNSMLVRLVAGH